MPEIDAAIAAKIKIFDSGLFHFSKIFGKFLDCVSVVGIDFAISSEFTDFFMKFTGISLKLSKR